MADAAQLAQHLANLPLPEYEPTFAALEQFRKPMPGTQGGVYYEGAEEAPFEELSLSFVRTVATIATTRRLGLLWGNDVLPPDSDAHPGRSAV
jgi:hypothetical protein